MENRMPGNYAEALGAPWPGKVADYPLCVR
jgi:hypothetical protein